LVAAVLIGLPVLYVASFGPVCWATSRIGGNEILPTLYRPILAVMAAPTDKAPLMPGIHGGRMCGYPTGALSSYATIGGAPGWMWRYSAVWEPIPGSHDFRRVTDWSWDLCDASK
jgi:hypothetical protein